MTHKPWYMPLSSKNQIFLLAHMTLGYRIVYPGMILSLSDFFHLQAYLDLGMGDIFLSVWMVLVALVIAQELYRSALEHFIKRPWFHLKVAFMSLGFMMLSSVLVNALATTLSGQTNSYNQSQIIEFMGSLPWILVFQALIFAPILEELMFRGLFFGFLRKLDRNLALLLSALLFGVAHLSGSLSVFQWTDLWFLPTYSLLGFFLALSYERSHSLLTPMLVHFLNNLIGLYAIFATGLLS